MAGLPHDPAPAVPGDVVVEALRALHLGDDHRARVARQHVASEEHEELVAPDDAALRVRDADAVGVAVEGDAELGPRLGDGADQGTHVVGDRRVGVVVREAAIRVAEQLAHPRPEPAVDVRRDRARRPVAGVDHDVDRAREAAHPPGDVVLVDGHDGAALDRPAARLQLAGLEAPAQVLDLLAVEGLLAEAELEAVVVRRVVAAGHLDAAVQVPMEEREVHERCGADADVEHLEAGRRDARGHRGRVAIGGEATVAAYRHHAPAGLGGEGAEGVAQAAREVGVEVPLGDAADVVFAEDGGIQSRTST